MIHPSAIIDPGAQISPDAEIGPFTVIGPDVVIGARCRIGSHAIVEYTRLGEGCAVFSHAVMGTPPQDLKYANEPTYLEIGEGTTIREFATLNRGTAAHGRTVVGAQCLIMAYAHVAHDCVVGSHVIMSNAVTLAGHVEVGDHAVLGGMCGVHQFTRIGHLAMVGGGAMVTQDILPYCQTQGDRSRLVGLNLVGMKRRGVSADVREEIKAAYKTLFLSGLPADEALDQLEASAPCDEVREIIAFIHSSRRGICRPSRKETEEEI